MYLKVYHIWGTVHVKDIGENKQLVFVTFVIIVLFLLFDMFIKVLFACWYNYISKGTKSLSVLIEKYLRCIINCRGDPRGRLLPYTEPLVKHSRI